MPFSFFRFVICLDRSPPPFSFFFSVVMLACILYLPLQCSMIGSPLVRVSLRFFFSNAHINPPSYPFSVSCCPVCSSAPLVLWLLYFHDVSRSLFSPLIIDEHG